MKIHEAFRYVVVISATDTQTRKFIVKISPGQQKSYENIADVPIDEMYIEEPDALEHVLTINTYHGDGVASVLAVPVDKGHPLSMILGTLKGNLTQ